jgi:hypothetical protein
MSIIKTITQHNKFYQLEKFGGDPFDSVFEIEKSNPYWDRQLKKSNPFVDYESKLLKSPLIEVYGDYNSFDEVIYFEGDTTFGYEGVKITCPPIINPLLGEGYFIPTIYLSYEDDDILVTIQGCMNYYEDGYHCVECCYDKEKLVPERYEGNVLYEHILKLNKSQIDYCRSKLDDFKKNSNTVLGTDYCF